MVESQLAVENSKYGQFIIQTNEVQFYLNLVVLLRTYAPNKKIRDYLERLELGNLIGCFRICTKNPTELALADALNNYKDSRNALAHKMFTNRKLTVKECELSIELGKELLIGLKRIIKEGINLKT
jgi:hypothetical protein